jgi:hypothetical protein
MRFPHAADPYAHPWATSDPSVRLPFPVLLTRREELPHLRSTLRFRPSPTAVRALVVAVARHATRHPNRFATCVAPIAEHPAPFDLVATLFAGVVSNALNHDGPSPCRRNATPNSTEHTAPHKAPISCSLYTTSMRHLKKTLPTFS